MIPPMTPPGFNNFNGPMGNYPSNVPMNYNPMGYYGAPPVPPTGLPFTASQVVPSQTNLPNSMINSGLMMSSVSAFPPTMNGYETGIAGSMAGYGTNINMMNTGIPMMPSVPVAMNTTVVTNSNSRVLITGNNSNSRVLITGNNSNSRVLIGGGNNSNSRVIIAPPIYNKAVLQQRPVESRMEYIPYQTKEIVYDTIQKREVIPIQKTITEYEQLKHIQTIPIEKSVTDYYAIEYLTEYMPTVKNQTVVDYIQQEVINEHINYRPVDTQRVIPNPQLRNSGVNVLNATTVTTPTIMTPGNVGNPMCYGQNNMYGPPPVAPMMQPNPSMVNSVHSNYSANGINPIDASLYAGMKTAPLF